MLDGRAASVVVVAVSVVVGAAVVVGAGAVVVGPTVVVGTAVGGGEVVVVPVSAAAAVARISAAAKAAIADAGAMDEHYGVGARRRIGTGMASSSNGTRLSTMGSTSSNASAARPTPGRCHSRSASSTSADT